MAKPSPQPRGSRFMRRFLMAAAAVVLVTWCSISINHASPSPQRRVPSPPSSASGGLLFRLGVDGGSEKKPAALPTAPSSPLPEGEVARILARLSPLKTDATDKTEFRVRERSLPAPRTGRTIQGDFPPAAPGGPPPTVASGPLEVLRHAPEGAVPIAPSLDVTFNQPMVPITSLAELSAQEAPARLAPQPEGRWRWIGAKTLLFQPAVRFPMATHFSVEVPAGTKSAVGGTLQSAVKWTFDTPTVGLKSHYPSSDSEPRDPVMVATFDQRIDAAAVLATIHVTADGKDVPVRLATAQELEADKTAHSISDAAEAGRFVAFRAASLLPGNSNIRVVVGPNTPSAEGPLKTTKAQEFDFHTYGPLRVTSSHCGYGDCRPMQPFYVQFSNTLDAASFKPSMLKAQPPIQGMKVDVSGSTMMIRGRTRGRTTYTVTLDTSIRDRWQQSLVPTPPLVFKVGSAEPSLSASGGQMVTVDPDGNPTFSVFTVNHKALRVRMRAVRPEDWNAYVKSIHDYGEKPPPLPGRMVVDTVVEPKAEQDELVETPLDLRPALKNGFGQVILTVEPTVQPKERWRRQKVVTWAQVTRLGLDGFVDHETLLAWASSLKDGSPIAGAEITLLPQGAHATSGADGTVSLPLPTTSAPGAAIVVGRLGDDLGFLPSDPQGYGYESAWVRSTPSNELRWYMFDDRKMYKPGEEVRAKGWLRKVGGGPQGDVGALGDAVRTVTWTLVDSRGNEITKGLKTLDPLGGFDLAVKLPPTMNLGNASLRLEAQGGTGGVYGTSHTHSFQVQEFRRPEFEVTSTPSEGPHFVGGHASVSLLAKYYAGGGLPNAPVAWVVTATPGWFTPPGRSGFSFGRWRAWWMPWSNDASRTQSFAGVTDGAGKSALGIDFDSVEPPRPTTLRVQGTVHDVNRQAWAAQSTLLVHPSSLYVGLKALRSFVQAGDPLHVDVIVTDLDGKAVTGREIVLKASLMDWKWENGSYREIEGDPQETRLVSAAEPVRWSFKPREGGRYRVTARVVDDKLHPNESDLSLWVAGGRVQPQRNVEKEKVTLIPDKENYQPGDTAEILVQAPFTPAEGLLTLRRSGLVRSERFKMTGSSYTLKIPVEEGFVPNLHVQVDLVGSQVRVRDDGEADPGLPRRPAYASGSLNLPVPPLDRTLALQVKAREAALEPGGQTTIDVQVLDNRKSPVAGSQVAVVVVDEAVLALTGYRVPDPVGIFYAQRSSDVADHHSRQTVVLARKEVPPPAPPMEQRMMRNGAVAMPSTVAPSPSAPMMKSSASLGAPAKPQPAIQVRSDFNALATFVAAVGTDAQGHVQVPVKVPDNLTRYRIMVVAVSGGRHFGQGESTLVARLPLMVRPSAPRFLNFGDRFELPVVLQNQTDQAMDIQVAVRGTNVKLTAGAGRTVRVPANDRVEVRFPAAAEQAGTARFQVAAVSGKSTDASEFSLPVWTPATSEAFATYGQIDQGAIAQPVRTPGEVFPQFGGLEVTTSSTALQALTDAVLYLQAYPFECSEQLSSRILSVAALRDVLTAFRAEGLPSAKAMVAAVARDIARLKGLQHYDGGFGFWRFDEPDWPYLSVHVAHALVRAKLKGFEVPQEMLDRSRSYLRSIESHIPGWYSPEARRAIVSYALYVRKWMGEADPAKARSILQQAGGPKGLGVESVGWLLAVLSGDKSSQAEVTAIRRYLLNRVTETAAAAHFACDYGDSAHLLLYSNRRADAIVLEAMIGDQPKSDLIPKIVTGLLAHRTRGRWGNTQENVFVLLALDRYFNTYEKTTPDFVARVWLGDRYAGDHPFKGRSTDRYNIDVPMRWLADSKQATQNLIVDKQGAGRLYYRIGMTYAPRDLNLKPLDEGFAVQRVYEGVDDPKDVRRDEQGTWHIKAGARVRVRLTMVAPTRRYHVALVDPLPAGLEAMNPALAVTGQVPQDPSARQNAGPWWWWMRPWYEHQNLRDERAEAFASLLWAGVHNYVYVARATTPGNFVVPPPKAEEMYHPETFGRGASDHVIVE